MKCQNVLPTNIQWSKFANESHRKVWHIASVVLTHDCAYLVSQGFIERGLHLGGRGTFSLPRLALASLDF